MCLCVTRSCREWGTNYFLMKMSLKPARFKVALPRIFKCKLGQWKHEVFLWFPQQILLVSDRRVPQQQTLRGYGPLEVGPTSFERLKGLSGNPFWFTDALSQGDIHSPPKPAETAVCRGLLQFSWSGLCAANNHREPQSSICNQG